MEKIDRLFEEQKKTNEKVDKIYESLVGDPLENRKGLIYQVEKNAEDISKLRSKVSEIKSPWGKIAISGTAGTGLGSLLGANWGHVVKKIITFFN